MDKSISEPILPETNRDINISVLLIACDREKLIQSTLNQLNIIRSNTSFTFRNRYHFDNKTIDQMIELPIIVSQDCGNLAVSSMIENYVYRNIVQYHFKYPFWNNPVTLQNSEHKKLQGYYKISRHYKWAIDQVFRIYPKVDKLIIVEDDLNFSPDFFEYFITLAPLLDLDNSVYCISAWNDNGKNDLVDSNAISMLYRTDFFPGLGWMLKRSIWEEVKGNWPFAFWDDWFRNREQRKERSCIYPELSRTSTSGSKGVSKGQFYKQHLSYIHHYEQYYSFYENQTMILNNLQSNKYDQWFLVQVYNESKEINPLELKIIDQIDQNQSYRITYYTQKEFINYASMFGLMTDFKFGIPRTAYKGIVTFLYKKIRFYLAPPRSRKIYLINWK